MKIELNKFAKEYIGDICMTAIIITCIICCS